MKLLFLFLAGFPAAWADQPDPVTYLNQMGEALKTLNYHGTLVYSHDGQLESMQLIHKKDKNGEYERLVHLSGAPREVIRKNDVVTSYLPDSRSVVVRQRRFNSHLFAKLSKNIGDFVGVYNILLGGTDRVAGRQTHIILIQPKDQYRYGYRLWVDQSSGLLLKSELTESGKPLEQMMFVNIEVLKNIPDTMLNPGVSGEAYTWHHNKKDDRAPSVNANWEVKQLPNGFMVTGHYIQQIQNSDQSAEHLVISDGLASISIYIEDIGAENQGYAGAFRKGAVNIYGSKYDNHQVTVVGEVPHETVKFIAGSLNHTQK
ncbi:MAG: MucB/RseB C-terminal domain-containing protein [Gammaproteobacteria bacterium]|nr:MucB/RseB C-terminal domain-containing protein [Gammaproteobacteria bacterium]MDH5801030.1 MucB/RseB C-terminal domain-containing protein [Gammaproteobacteria bacterium]